MSKQIEKALRIYLIFWGLYLIFEGLLYILNIRLIDTRNIWPPAALAYARLLEKVLGSIFLFVAAVIIFEVQRNLLKYKNFIKIGGIWAFFHGILLIFLGTTQNYAEVFKPYPSLLVWFPWYREYVVLEGLAAIGLSILVYLYQKKL